MIVIELVKNGGEKNHSVFFVFGWNFSAVKSCYKTVIRKNVLKNKKKI